MSKPIHVFMCSCDSKEMEPAEFKKHLSEVHNLKTKEELTGTKQMTSHIDYDKSYSFLYEWTDMYSGIKVRRCL
jgi:hypothetical protein